MEQKIEGKTGVQGTGIVHILMMYGSQIHDDKFNVVGMKQEGLQKACSMNMHRNQRHNRVAVAQETGDEVTCEACLKGRGYSDICKNDFMAYVKKWGGK